MEGTCDLWLLRLIPHCKSTVSTCDAPNLSVFYFSAGKRQKDLENSALLPFQMQRQLWSHCQEDR